MSMSKIGQQEHVNLSVANIGSGYSGHRHIDGLAACTHTSSRIEQEHSHFQIWETQALAATRCVAVIMHDNVYGMSKVQL